MSEEVVPANSSKTKTIHILPTISLDSTDMAEVKDYDVGQTYDAIIHCEMVSKHQGDNGPWGEDENPGIVRGRFKIISIKPLDSKPNSDKLKALKNKASSY